jgi:hypothetical protein
MLGLMELVMVRNPLKPKNQDASGGVQLFKCLHGRTPIKRFIQFISFNGKRKRLLFIRPALIGQARVGTLGVL